MTRWHGDDQGMATLETTLMVVILAKRPADVDELGSVTDRWIAEHRSQ